MQYKMLGKALSWQNLLLFTKPGFVVSIKAGILHHRTHKSIVIEEYMEVSMQTEQRPHRHFQVGQKKAIAGSIPPSSLLAASILCMLTAAALLWAYLLSK